MNPKQRVFDKLALRTHPFFPETDSLGNALPREGLLKDLQPDLDDRLLNYYFDVYDWSDSALVRGLSTTAAGLQNFPGPGDPNLPLLILVSGFASTGRDSLINLIIHKIHSTHSAEPLSVRSDVSEDAEESVRNIALDFITAWGKSRPSAERPAVTAALNASYELHTKVKSTGADAHYQPLFRAFAGEIEVKKVPPIVLIVSGGKADVWRALYNSTRSLARYIVAVTPYEARAGTCRTQMTLENKPTVHIRARELRSDAARDYTMTRIAYERPPGHIGHPLLPFTEAALNVLYKRGQNAPPDFEKEWPIGWLRETLRRAVDHHVEKLVELIQKNGEDALNKLSPADLLIDEDLVWAVRQKMNWGQG